MHVSLHFIEWPDPRCDVGVTSLKLQQCTRTEEIICVGLEAGTSPTLLDSTKRRSDSQGSWQGAPQVESLGNF